MKIEFSLNEINKAVVLLSEKLIHPIICFNGDLGAGKTTFIRQLCLKWGVMDNISSPTFSIINQYKSTSKGNVFHFDFYRMEDAKEAMDIGVEEYLDSGQICLIEWGEKIESLLPQENIHIVEISLTADNKRVLELKK
jgi:tRNA threonylcarbamoyladenosine biosynthesis protein TsaE